MNIKSFVGGFFQQLSAKRGFLLRLYLPIFGFLAALFSLAIFTKTVNIYQLVGDITSEAHVPFYVGALSQIGMLFWAAGATVCCLTLLFLSKQGALEPATRRFLLLASAFNIVLMLDDMFLFHEEIAPDYLGINEKIVMITYLLLGLSFVFFNWQEILDSEYAILGLALGLFAISIFFDAIPDPWYKSIYTLDKLEHMIEDGAKFAGIVTWLAFFTRYAYAKFSQLIGMPGKTPG